MRKLLILAAALLLPAALTAQTDLTRALTGDWVGVLEYRDYSEPAGSTKRVQLPTWLSITGAGPLTWRYIYDDGPAKTVEETDIVTFNPATSTYTETTNGKPAQTSTITGYDSLKSGRGVLILNRIATDNDKPAELRVTLTIRRNLLQMLEEVRPVGSTGAYTFRHNFTFTRATAPVVPAASGPAPH